MDQQEIEFVPKYTFRSRAALWIAPVFAVGAVWLALTQGRRDPKLYLTLLFVPALPLILARTYRRVRFGRSIVLERYLLPPKTIEYSSITDVGVGVLKTTQGNVVFMSMNCNNVDEFDTAVAESRKSGYWSDTQIKGKLIGQQAASAKSTMIAAPVALVGATIAVFAKPGGLRFHWSVWFVAIYLPLGLGLYAYYRRRVGES